MRRCFGVPGTQLVNFLDHLVDSGVAFHLAAHEGGAAFMANGHFRASGEVALLATIGGPGFTNALTGIAEARLDSVALLHVVNGTAPGAAERFELQAIGQDEVADVLYKEVFRVSPGTDVGDTVDRALEVARTGEPGPVLLQFSESGEIGAAPARVGPKVRERRHGKIDGISIADLVARWRSARRPIFLLGQGAREAAGVLTTVVERVGVPVLTTTSGRGLVSEATPWVLGFDALRGGLDTLNSLLMEADLVVGIGAKLGHNGTAGFQLKLDPERFVHADASPTSLVGGRYSGALLHATALEVGEALAPCDRGTSEWAPTRVAEARRLLRTAAADPTEPRIWWGGRRVPAHDFFIWLQKRLSDDTRFVTDSGQHQISARRYMEVRRPAGLIVPSDLQSMGYGLPAAIGASLADPDAPVVALSGDGGFRMSGFELVTAVRESVPLLVVVFSDGALNQIRLHQLRDHGRTAGVDLGTLDLRGFCDAAGCDYVRFDGSQDPGTMLTDATGPVLLEVGVGDAPLTPLVAARARGRGVVRRALGDRVISRLKSVLRRFRRTT